MKASKIILSLALVGTLGFADAINTNSEISQKIEAIQSSAPQDRTKMMNQLKSEMQNMSPQDRQEVMTQMQTKMNVDMSSMQEHTQKMQMNHNESMNREQHMNQGQAGNEYGHSANEHVGSTSYNSDSFEIKH